MNKVICIDTSGLLVPTVKVYNRQLQQIVLQRKNYLIRELGEKTSEWTDFDFLQEIKRRKQLPFVMQPHVMYFNSLLSCLKKIGVDKDDIIIMALEGHSWRKDHDSRYKSHRKSQRDSDSCVDWSVEYKKCNTLHDNLEEATDWHFIRDWKFGEADDVCAVTSRVFSDREVIIITGDKDLHQLIHYDNVKIFNTNKKIKGSKGVYETSVTKPLKIIASKAEKGDAGDNLNPEPDDTDEDYELRYYLVNLLELPDYVESSIKKQLTNLPKKELNLENLPKFKDVKIKFLKIYDKDKIISFDYCKKLTDKRHRQKLDKAKEKRKQLKEAKKEKKNEVTV